MWNDTDIPLGYLITFRCHGTRLHGDERGSIDRVNNGYQTPYISPNSNWHAHNKKQLGSEPITLNAAQRNAVERAIRETCEKRKWLLHAVNARTNHVHSVITAGKPPGVMLNALKANATRIMREKGLWLSTRSPWSDKRKQATSLE